MVVSLKRWQGSLAIVTGASSGIGEAISIELVKAGVNVLGLARRKVKLDELAERVKNQPGKFCSYVTDVTKEEDILNAFRWAEDNLGPVHILVNSAGIRKNTNLVEGDTQFWKETLDTNVIGLCIATREAFKNMKKNNVDGHIIHINSTLGHKVEYKPQLNVYSASKFAVTALTETLRLELNTIGNKTKITSVSPGYVDNDFRRVSNLPSFDNIPSIKSEDVAHTVLYVLSTPPHVQVHDILIRAVGEQF